MDELLKTLEAMSIEDLECVIGKVQELIQKKRQEAILLAELEKQRQEQERLEAERQKQEEIARLQQRLKELQGESHEDVQPEIPEKDTTSDSEKTTVDRNSKEQDYNMVACPQCHKLVPSDSRFCFYCGSDIQQKAEKKDADVTCPYCHSAVPSGSQFCQNCGKSVGNANQNTKP